MLTMQYTREILGLLEWKEYPRLQRLSMDQAENVGATGSVEVYHNSLFVVLMWCVCKVRR